jgi:hypothetical protein
MRLSSGVKFFEASTSFFANRVLGGGEVAGARIGGKQRGFWPAPIKTVVTIRHIVVFFQLLL